MGALLFERTLARPEMLAVFADEALVEAMLAFEAALAESEAAAGAIPATAVAAIVAACRTGFDVEALVDEARPAGSLAIPLVKRLTARVAEHDAAAAAYVHWGSTSQDVIDTAMALATKRALALLDAELARLTASLVALARQQSVGHPVRLEASGGLALDNAAAVAATGVDYLAVGALTHSAAVLDIGLDLS